jgi:23S rRNA pseudouridine1911/1915/1917 synthase
VIGVGDGELHLRIEAAMAGMRIDRLLAEHFPEHTRSRFQKLCRDGHVTARGKRVRSAYRVLLDDDIRVRVPAPEPSHLVPENIPIPVVYEDDDLLVVDKPAGLVVHPAVGNATGTLVHALLFRDVQLAAGGDAIRPGIVHRLDKDTSGLLVVAKNERAHVGLAAALRDRNMRREYVALVWGRVAADSGRIEGAIGRSPTDRKRMAVVTKGGKPATTHWAVRERLEFTTCLDVRLGTGRTHQIRVHLAHANHPVFGDPVYGGRNSRLTGLPAGSRVLARQALAGLPRQALHAARLSFRHPVNGVDLRFEAALPDDFARTLALLRRPIGEPAA